MRLSFATINKNMRKLKKEINFGTTFYAIILLNLPLAYAEVFVTLTRLPSES